MPESGLTVSVPLYANKSEIWKIILAARRKRPAGRKTDGLLFIACHIAMIDFVTGTNQERFSQGALVRAVQKLLQERKEVLNCGGEIAVPHINTLKNRCRDWLIWRASKPDVALNAVQRTNVREALEGLRYTVTEDIWKSRYCEVEMPDGLGKMGVSKDKINWNNEQVRITKLVRSLPLFSKSNKTPSLKS